MIVLSALAVFAFAPERATSGASFNPPTASARAVAIADRAASRRGNRSEIAVLGTAHLSALPKDFDRRRFAVLVARLAAWKPDRIAIEGLPGAQCDELRAYASAFPDTAQAAKTYCFDPLPARRALGINGPAASKEVEAILAQPAADRSAAQRRRLTALFLAVGEPDSANVQWLRLPAAERHAGDSMTAELVSVIETHAVRQNEDQLIAVPLAVQLKHERLYPVDDHNGDRSAGTVDEASWAREIKAIWDNPAARSRREAQKQWDSRLAAGGSLLGWYRWLNSPAAARLAVSGDFGAAAESQTPTGRSYLGYWETRNMRMAANIRQAVGSGARLLAIVGASHKAYYERYLGVTSDIVIKDIEPLLHE